MTLSKEVKDIIQDAFAFLSNTLKSETLSETTDTLRRKLLAQIRKFAQTNQSFRIFLPSDDSERSFVGLFHDGHQTNLNNGSYRLSTSSGSTNYSIGFSGDDATSSPQTIMEDTSSIEDKDDFYEEFEEINECARSLQNSSNGHMRSHKSSKFSNETKVTEYSYSIVKNMPFRNLIARCDHHGIINKKSKSILKSSRYFGVFADCLLHLYNKESDNKPKRVIDLREYIAQCNLHEDGKKKKEFHFDLISPGRKSHSFTAVTDRERHHWVDILNRSINTRNNCASKPYNIISDCNDLSIHTNESSLCYKPTESIIDQVDVELYEEIMENDISCQRLHHNYENEQSSDIKEIDEHPKYYEVVEESDMDVNNFNVLLFESRPGKKLNKPERPPLPEILKQKMGQSRPLPPEPTIRSSSESSFNPSIYWEIDSSFEADNETSTMINDSLNSRSLSQEFFEIFDTINERVPILPDNYQTELTTYSKQDLTTEDVQYEVPSEVYRNSRDNDSGSTNHCQYDSGNNSVYQIPSNSRSICDIYQVPPAPVPILSIKPVDSLSFKDKQEELNDNEWNSSQGINPQKNHVKPNCLSDSIDDDRGKHIHCEEKLNLEESLSSVKEIIKRLNDNAELSNLGSSVKKMSVEKTHNDEKYLQNQSSSFSALINERDNSTNDVITVSIHYDELSSPAIDVNTGIFIAKFAYVQDKPNELSFSRGDRILVVDASQKTWWKGELRGKKGYVPRDYLRRIDF